MTNLIIILPAAVLIFLLGEAILSIRDNKKRKQINFSVPKQIHGDMLSLDLVGSNWLLQQPDGWLLLQERGKELRLEFVNFLNPDIEHLIAFSTNYWTEEKVNKIFFDHMVESGIYANNNETKSLVSSWNEEWAKAQDAYYYTIHIANLDRQLS